MWRGCREGGVAEEGRLGPYSVVGVQWEAQDTPPRGRALRTRSAGDNAVKERIVVVSVGLSAHHGAGRAGYWLSEAASAGRKRRTPQNKVGAAK